MKTWKAKGTLLYHGATNGLALKSLGLDFLLPERIKPYLFNWVFCYYSQKHANTSLCNLQLLI